MSDPNGSTPERRHFKIEVTDDKLCRYLDTAREFDIEIVHIQRFGRHWEIVTYPLPIPGPAGRRVFRKGVGHDDHQQHEDEISRAYARRDH